MSIASVMAIKSHLRTYEVLKTGTLSEALRAATSEPEELKGSESFFLVDQNVYRLYLSTFSVLEPARTLLVTATEGQKSYEALVPIFEQLLSKGFRKNSKLVVIGGGIVQDMGCFIASVFARGIRWVLLPTTLLAQGDSCIGGKSSLNLGAYKNPLGTFYPPDRIILCADVLKTLEFSALQSGLSEIIKLALIEGPVESGALFRQMSADFNKFMMIEQGAVKLTAAVDSIPFSKWVTEALVIKKRFVEADEFDTGIRNLLNYGHTYGHAFESASKFAIPHGVAVALGMCAATFASYKRGYVTLEHFQEVQAALRFLYLPFEQELLKLDLLKIESAMRSDKKNSGNKIGCILTHGFGKIKKEQLDWESEVKPALEEWLTVV